MTASPQKILVVAAHPDDEILGAGGSLRKLVLAGAEVRCLILSEGTAARGTDQAAVARRLAECRAAAGLIGMAEPEVAGFPDNRFDAVALLEIVQAVEKRLAAFRPEIIYTHHGGDLNIDHRLTQDAVMTACRPCASFRPRRILAFEVSSSSDWRYDQASAFVPNVFEDISGTLDTKLAALGAYASEARAFPHPRSPEGLRALAAVRGGQCGRSAAEGFRLLVEFPA